MQFNPLFVSEFPGDVNKLLKPSKMNNPKFLFTDIIKILCNYSTVGKESEPVLKEPQGISTEQAQSILKNLVGKAINLTSEIKPTQDLLPECHLDQAKKTPLSEDKEDDGSKKNDQIKNNIDDLQSLELFPNNYKILPLLINSDSPEAIRYDQSSNDLISVEPKNTTIETSVQPQSVQETIADALKNTEAVTPEVPKSFQLKPVDLQNSTETMISEQPKSTPVVTSEVSKNTTASTSEVLKNIQNMAADVPQNTPVVTSELQKNTNTVISEQLKSVQSTPIDTQKSTKTMASELPKSTSVPYIVRPQSVDIETSLQPESVQIPAADVPSIPVVFSEVPKNTTAVQTEVTKNITAVQTEVPKNTTALQTEIPKTTSAVTSGLPKSVQIPTVDLQKRTENLTSIQQKIIPEFSSQINKNTTTITVEHSKIAATVNSEQPENIVSLNSDQLINSDIINSEQPQTTRVVTTSPKLILYKQEAPSAIEENNSLKNITNENPGAKKAFANTELLFQMAEKTFELPANYNSLALFKEKFVNKVNKESVLPAKETNTEMLVASDLDYQKSNSSIIEETKLKLEKETPVFIKKLNLFAIKSTEDGNPSKIVKPETDIEPTKLKTVENVFPNEIIEIPEISTLNETDESIPVSPKKLKHVENQITSEKIEPDLEIVKDSKIIMTPEVEKILSHEKPDITLAPVKEVQLAKLIPELKKNFSEIQHSQEIKIKVVPEGLGNVKIEMTVKEQHLNAKIEVDSEVVKNVLMNNSNELKQSLNQNGINLQSLNILLSGEPQKQKFFQTKKLKTKTSETVVSDKNSPARKLQNYSTYEFWA